MIDKLTPEQEAIKEEVKRDWIAAVDGCPSLNYKDLREGTDAIYKLIDLPPPRIFIAQGPRDAQCICNWLESTGELVLPGRVEVGKDGAGCIPPGNAYNPENVKRDKYYNFSWYGSVTDFGWCAWYDFFDRIGQPLKQDNWPPFRQFIRSGLFDTIQLTDLLVVLPMPKYIKRFNGMESRPLHCVDGPAIEWDDGVKLHRLWGVQFDKELFNRLTSRSMSAKEVLAIENMEQRMAALKLLDVETVLDSLDAKFIKEVEGYSLYSVDGLTDDREYALKYACPSTGRVYVKWINPEGFDPQHPRSPVIAIARSAELTLQEWDNIGQHS